MVVDLRDSKVPSSAALPASSSAVVSSNFVGTEEGCSLASQIHASAFIECSAKLGTGLEVVFFSYSFVHLPFFFFVYSKILFSIAHTLVPFLFRVYFHPLQDPCLNEFSSYRIFFNSSLGVNVKVDSILILQISFPKGNQNLSR